MGYLIRNTYNKGWYDKYLIGRSQGSLQLDWWLLRSPLLPAIAWLGGSKGNVGTVAVAEWWSGRVSRGVTSAIGRHRIFYKGLSKDLMLFNHIARW